MTVEFVATDLDGTFINRHHKILPDTIKTYRECRSRGIPVVICTGRMQYTATTAVRGGVEGGDESFYDEVKFFPGAYAHGCLAFGDTEDEILICRSLSLDLSLQLLKLVYDLSDRLGLTPYVSLYTQKYIVIDQTGPEFETQCTRYNEPYEKCLGMRMLDSPEVREQLKDYTIVYLSATYTQGSPSTFTDAVDASPEFQAFLNEHNLRHVTPLPEQVAFISKDGNKADALKQICKKFGVSNSHVLALGDSNNDIEMLKWASVGAAMGEADPIVKAAASYQAPKSIDNGWAHTVRKYALSDVKEEDNLSEAETEASPAMIRATP